MAKWLAPPISGVETFHFLFAISEKLQRADKVSECWWHEMFYKLNVWSLSVFFFLALDGIFML